MSASQLIKILQFGDSVLPVGAFSFSNGVESAIQTGVVSDKKTLKTFVQTALKQAASSDCLAMIVAHQAFMADNTALLIEADYAVYNRKLNEESRTMVTRMGKKLAELAAHTTNHPKILWWLEQIKSSKTVGTYPITQALIMASQDVSAEQLCVMHHYGVAMTILSAATRLMRITHMDVQEIVFELNQEMADLCHIPEKAELDQMSSYAPVVDVLAAHHVQAHVRLFMN